MKNNFTNQTFSLHQLRGYKGMLTRSINQCKDGAYVLIDMKTALALQHFIETAITNTRTTK